MIPYFAAKYCSGAIRGQTTSVIGPNFLSYRIGSLNVPHASDFVSKPWFVKAQTEPTIPTLLVLRTGDNSAESLFVQCFRWRSE